MLKVNATCWKRIVSLCGQGGYEQRNVQHGDDSERLYLKDGEVMARMLVLGANTERPAYENERVFWASDAMIAASQAVELPHDAFEMEDVVDF